MGNQWETGSNLVAIEPNIGRQENGIGLREEPKMIETERLILKPLTGGQLVKYARCDNSLESELNLLESSRKISGELKEALEQMIIPNVIDKSKDYLYSTLWTAILKSEKRMVGDICMYGEPNANGEVEIGYGTYDEFRNRGYMSEMVCGIIGWAANQRIVTSILASTEKTNPASFRVLEKNKFIKTGETETLFLWKLELNKNKR